MTTILEPNCIVDYPAFRELMVDTHAFRDLEHIYMALGPNALALYHRQTRKLMLLGYYIHKHNVTLFEERSKRFLPGVFDFEAWKQFCGRKTRYEFGQRFERALSITYVRHEASLQVDESSLARTFVDMQSPESNKYNDSVRACEDVWSRLTRVHAESPHYGASAGAPADRFPSSISSIAKERSDGAVFSKSGQDGTYCDGEALPTSTIRVQTRQDEPSDPSDGSSLGTSGYSTASDGSSSDSLSDSDGSGC